MTGFPKTSRWVVAAAAVACGLWLVGSALADDDRIRIVDRGVVVIDDDDDDANDPHIFVAHAGEGHGTSAFLGVHVEEETDLSEGGARVVAVVDDSPAEAAGLEDGDVIVGIDGRTVRGPAGLRKQLRDVEPGTEVKVDVVRNGESRSFTAELDEPRGFSLRFGDGDFAWDSEAFDEKMELLGDKPGNMDFGRIHGDHGFNVFVGGRPKLGVELVSTTPDLREHLGGSRDAGVLVGRVLEGMPAEEAGVRVGDLIEAVDGREVSDAGDLVRELRDSEGSTITLDIVRDGRAQKIDVTIPELDDRRSLGPRATIELLPELDGLGDHIRRALEEAHRAMEGLHIERLHERHGPVTDEPARPIDRERRTKAGLDA